jgi:hypothetical protein
MLRGGCGTQIRTRKWIGQQSLPAKLNQAIDPLASIDALDGHQDARLWCELQHCLGADKGANQVCQLRCCHRFQL